MALRLQHERYAVGVFDGHGDDDDAVETAEAVVRTYLQIHRDAFGETLMHEVFARAADATSHFVSGTTAAISFLGQDGSVRIGIVGNSIGIARLPDGRIVRSAHHDIRTNRRERDAVARRGGICCGGYACKRADGMQVNVSRALGDSDMQPILSDQPEIDVWSLAPQGWLALVSDGVLDPARNRHSKQLREFAAMVDGGASAADLIERCHSKSHDDASAIVCRYTRS